MRRALNCPFSITALMTSAEGEDFFRGISERGLGLFFALPGAHEYPLSGGKPEIIVVILPYLSDNGG